VIMCVLAWTRVPGYVCITSAQQPWWWDPGTRVPPGIRYPRVHDRVPGGYLGTRTGPRIAQTVNNETKSTGH